MTKEEIAEAAYYTIFRTGNSNKRHYQVNKMIMGVEQEKYWVQLNGRDSCFCDCPGFRRQSFAKMEHKHIKIALDYSARGEPKDATYRITGTGVKAQIRYIDTRRDT